MANKDNLFFHSAEVYVTPLTGDITPRRIAVIQDVSIEIKRDMKELFGENKYAEDAASGNESISGKYKSGELDPDWMMTAAMEGVKTSGILVLEKAEVHTVATATVTVTEAADFAGDYGVINPATGKAFKKVAATATPSAGEYKVNESTGVYTFNALDNGKSLAFTYMREEATGETYTVNNSLAGDSVFASLLLYKTSRTKKVFGLRLANAAFESTSFGFKLNEYAMPEGSFKGFAGANGKVFEMFRGA